MNLFLVAAGLLLLALPGRSVALGRRLAPADWARLAAGSMSTGFLALRVGLLATATPTLLRLAGGHDLAMACHELLRPVVPGGAITGVLSALALAVIQQRHSRALLAGRRARRALRVEPWLGQHHRRDDHDLVVIPSPTVCAYALDGRPPQIVVSEGLATTLTDDELAAVISHERCHVRCGHQRPLARATATEAALRPLRSVGRSATIVRLAVERWADEAAADHNDRSIVRSALGKVVATMLGEAPAAVPAFTGADTILERLSALDRTPRTLLRWRLAAAAPAVILIVTAASTVMAGATTLHHDLLGLARLCPFAP